MFQIIRKRGASSRNFNRKQEFIQHVRDCLRRGVELHGDRFTKPAAGDVANLPIVFFEKGAVAGWAKYGRMNHLHNINLEFNIAYIENNWDDMVEDTIPHEVAHVIDYLIRGYSNHDKHWERIAKSLGCSGNRTHNYQVQYARRPRTQTKHLYIATCGTEFMASTTRHKRIQQGTVYYLKKTGGKIHRTGYAGKV